MTLFIPPIIGKTIIIPENINRICYYTDFFYNLPDHDFIYYLNDRLLYSDPPDGKLFDSGLRRKLLNVILIHKKLKQIIKKNAIDKSPHLTIDITSNKGEKLANKLMGFLGLEMRKEENNQYKIMIDSSIGIIDYYRFSRFNIGKIEKQINRTKRFYFKIRESKVHIPWNFNFLRAISGLDVTPYTFFETLLKNERFSLLISVLYRLSENEEDFISNLIPNPKYQAWQQIYQDKKLLIGLFVLSHALRVKDNQLILPGGEEAVTFWSQLAGCDYNESPFKFIKSIATKDEGKLNYLYVFSFFLSEDSQKILLFNFDVNKMQNIYDRISLTKKARIQTSRFPRLSDFNFFLLLYALRTRDARVWFPGGIEPWMTAIDNQTTQESQSESQNLNEFQFFKTLLERSEGNKKKMSAIQKFTSLYCKFFDRPQILTRKNIIKLYQNYEQYNVLVDFIEKIPLKKPEIINQLLDWVIKFDKIKKKDKTLFIAIFQSLFEIFSHQAKFAPQDHDYDHLISQLIKIPFSKATFYNSIFDFFETEMNIYLSKNTIDKTFITNILKGIPNQYINMNNRKHKFLVQDMIRNIINDIIQSQEVCPLSTLLEINSILKKIDQKSQKDISTLKIQLTETFNQIPHPEISDNAPRFIINRVKRYLKADLDKDVNNLIKKIESKASTNEINTIISKIKSDYLIHQLKDYLLALTYALNAKNERLRIFLNPNLTRLHDFEESNGNTPWNHSKTPTIKKKFPGFYFQGGLSRMNILFSKNWKDHLFSRNIIYDKEQIQSVIINLLEFYPIPTISRSQTYVGLIVEFGLELIQKARENHSINQDVLNELITITTGYHYRKITDFLLHKTKDYYLFFTEIFNLGERFLNKGKYLKEFSAYEKLSILTNTHLYQIVQEEMDQFGGIYYHTFGNLKPRKILLFPQEIANLFDSNWTGGEIINEFKIKSAYHAYKKKYPPQLLGQFLYHYLYNTCRKYLSQNYIKDYYSTYFIFDILNNSHLSKIVKKLQEKGQVRLK